MLCNEQFNLMNKIYSFGHNLGPTYLGCYVDKRNNRALGYADTMTSSDGSFLEHCINVCKEKNYEYTGLQDSKECFCGVNYSKHGSAKESECNSLCKDSTGTYCGGHFRLSVYKTGI